VIERVLLIGVVTPLIDKDDIEEHLDELALLVTTLGKKVVEKLIVTRKKIDSGTFIGKGKVEEIEKLIEPLDIHAVIFDDDLSASQTATLNKRLDIEIFDRSRVILDIFADHARSREAKTQVELARLEYMLPRLKRLWTHLERQTGGIGIRGGMGETQIEVDRRIVRTKILKLKKDLRIIEKERITQSKRRDNIFKVALIGYTNAGKSTLMNALTEADVLVQNKLFATLDTTVRKFFLDKNHLVLLSDTVGFIRKLPHDLVASFQSTLNEVKEADLIIKVADIGSPHCFHQLETVDEVLKEMNISDTDSIIVFNKIDTMDNVMLKHAQSKYPDSIFLSAKNKLRLSELNKSILDKIKSHEVHVKMNLPLQSVKIIAELRNQAIILTENYEGNNILLEFSCHKNIWSRLKNKFSDKIEYEIIE